MDAINRKGMGSLAILPERFSTKNVPERDSQMFCLSVIPPVTSGSKATGSTLSLNGIQHDKLLNLRGVLKGFRPWALIVPICPVLNPCFHERLGVEAKVGHHFGRESSPPLTS